MTFLSRIADTIQGSLAMLGLELRVNAAARASSSVQIMAVAGVPTDAPTNVGIALNVEGGDANAVLYVWYQGASAWEPVEANSALSGFTDGSTWFTVDTLQGLADAVVAALGGTSQGVRNYATNYVLVDDGSFFTGLSSLDAAFGDTLANLTTTSKVLVGAINEVDADAATGIANAATAQAAADALEAQVGVTVLANLTTTDQTGLQPAINEVDANADAAQVDATQALADAAAAQADADALGAENTDGQMSIHLLNGLADGGTWTPTVTSGGLVSIPRTAAAGGSSWWVEIPAPNRTAAGKGIKPTGLRINYSVNTADVDDVRFEIWKITQGADGAARTAAIVFGEDNLDYDAAHDTAAERGDDTAAPELHLAVVTDAGVPAYLGAGESLMLRCFVEGDAGGAGTVVITDAIMEYSETMVDLA